MEFPYVDVARIPQLAQELANDVDASLRFVDDFLFAWDERCARVLRAVDGGGLEDALVALLALSSSSAMVGATVLSAAARDLHVDARLIGAVPARGAARLSRIGTATCAELRRAASGWRAPLAG